MSAPAQPPGEWFDSIPTWPPARRRLAVAAAAVFGLGTFAALVPFLLTSPPPSAAAAPMPAWDTQQCLTGEWLRQFERHCKESAWLTIGLRGLHDDLAAARRPDATATDDGAGSTTNWRTASPWARPA